ncbi:MAG: glycosyltransferase [Taibaiella sp.]|nr:glycosyltransferase [Taibaiella sp.]
MLKVAIYSGGIPSSTFIERLILGVAEENITVYLFGKQGSAIKYPPNIKVVSYNGTLSKVRNIIKYGTLLFLSRRGDLFKANRLFKKRSDSFYSYYDRLVKYLPLLYYKPDILHLQWAKYIDDLVWVKEFDIKLILSLRGSHVNYSPIIDTKLVDIYKNNFPLVDAFHSVSKDLEIKAIAYTASNIKVVYSGLDMKRYIVPQVAEEKKDNYINIISVGRWHWVKGYQYAIDACKLLMDRRVRFTYTLIAGNAPEEILYQIRSLGLENRVTIKPKMPHKEVIKQMQRADVLLLPSIAEGIANVVLESMAVGTIVLSTDCGGMREVINDGDNGFLIPIRDSKAIADKIEFITALQEAKKDTIRKAARAKIEQQHTVEAMVNEMIELYVTTSES